jgi:hypothetical protein
MAGETLTSFSEADIGLSTEDEFVTETVTDVESPEAEAIFEAAVYELRPDGQLYAIQGRDDGTKQDVPHGQELTGEAGDKYSEALQALAGGATEFETTVVGVEGHTDTTECVVVMTYTRTSDNQVTISHRIENRPRELQPALTEPEDDGPRLTTDQSPKLPHAGQTPDFMAFDIATPGQPENATPEKSEQVHKAPEKSYWLVQDLAVPTPSLLDYLEQRPESNSAPETANPAESIFPAADLFEATKQDIPEAHEASELEPVTTEPEVKSTPRVEQVSPAVETTPIPEERSELPTEASVTVSASADTAKSPDGPKDPTDDPEPTGGLDFQPTDSKSTDQEQAVIQRPAAEIHAVAEAPQAVFEQTTPVDTGVQAAESAMPSTTAEHEGTSLPVADHLEPQITNLQVEAAGSIVSAQVETTSVKPVEELAIMDMAQATSAAETTRFEALTQPAAVEGPEKASVTRTEIAAPDEIHAESVAPEIADLAQPVVTAARTKPQRVTTAPVAEAAPSQPQVESADIAPVLAAPRVIESVQPPLEHISQRQSRRIEPTPMTVEAAKRSEQIVPPVVSTESQAPLRRVMNTSRSQQLAATDSGTIEITAMADQQPESRRRVLAKKAHLQVDPIRPDSATSYQAPPLPRSIYQEPVAPLSEAPRVPHVKSAETPASLPPVARINILQSDRRPEPAQEPATPILEPQAQIPIVEPVASERLTPVFERLTPDPETYVHAVDIQPINQSIEQPITSAEATNVVEEPAHTPLPVASIAPPITDQVITPLPEKAILETKSWQEDFGAAPAVPTPMTPSFRPITRAVHAETLNPAAPVAYQADSDDDATITVNFDTDSNGRHRTRSRRTKQATV